MTKKHWRKLKWQQEHSAEVLAKMKKEQEAYEADYGVEKKLYRYWLINGLLNSKEMLKQKYIEDDNNPILNLSLRGRSSVRSNPVANGDSKKNDYKRQLNYLRRQIFWHYFKNIFLFPIWLIKFLLPSFLKGTPNIWTNIKMIATKREFHPLRMAMFAWFVFTYLLIQGGIFYFRHAPPAEATAFTWIQTSWTASSSANAAHIDRASWTNYWDIYPTNITTTTGSQLTLTAIASSTVETSTADFDLGATSTASVTGNAVQLSEASGSAGISGGGGHTCANDNIGNAYCWGDNVFGQLGDDSVTQRTTPVQVKGVGGTGTLANIVGISAGGTTSDNYNHTCAYDSSGNVYCWGYNQNGQLGDNTATVKYTPVQVLGVGGVGTLANIVGISAGMSHTCAYDNSGNAYCWGKNSEGNLGDNSTTQRNTPVQVLGVGGTGTLANIVGISSGLYHNCAYDNSGNVYCWGNGGNGQLGNNSGATRLTPVQVLGVGGVGTLANIVGISAGSYHTCAYDNSGNAYCWGSNTNGKLGDNTTTQRYTPVQVLGVGGTGTLANIVGISSGLY
ncbi:MAG: hypothetical protein Q8O88_05355, partial [bacterium]|nr:hypothetical protein [bacterium]